MSRCENWVDVTFEIGGLELFLFGLAVARQHARRGKLGRPCL
jgi:hypothetical protein